MGKIDEYFKSKRVSNSLLGTVNNPRYIWLREMGLVEDVDKPFFRKGAAIDCMLTDPERWDEEFVVSEGNKPSGLLGKFVDALPRYVSKDDSEDIYLEAYKTAGYKASITNVIKWFWENESAVKYYKDRFLAEEGKELLGKEEYEEALYAVSVIKENEYIKKYFIPQEGEGNIERLLQLPIYFEWPLLVQDNALADVEETEIECKALLDGVYIDHDNKTIQPFDLKSTGKKVTDFPTSFTQFGYFRQAAFYLVALQHYLKIRNTYDLRNIADYEILPFKFIVVESKPGYSPALIFECSQHDLQCGWDGGHNKVTKEYHKGIIELLQDYVWHKTHNKWMMPKQAYLNGGVLQLDTFIKT